MTDAAPLILTLALADPDQARFDHLRALHFPSERNYLAAHVTLFHHLPGEDVDSISTILAERAGSQPAFPITVSGLRSLGRGVAYALASPTLSRLRADLAAAWSAILTPQDRQGFRAHITIQNKVDPADARALLADLAASFSPFEIAATGLLLWRYRGGPWEAAGHFAFSAE